MCTVHVWNDSQGIWEQYGKPMPKAKAIKTARRIGWNWSLFNGWNKRPGCFVAVHESL